MKILDTEKAIDPEKRTKTACQTLKSAAQVLVKCNISRVLQGRSLLELGKF